MLRPRSERWRFNPKQRIQEIWRKLSHLDAKPGQIAAGFSIGIAASFLPLNPSPIILGSAVAWLLRRNVIAAAAGGAMAMLYTPLVPFMWLGEYRLGKLILPVTHPLVIDQARMWEILHNSWDVYAAMLIGSIVMATPVTVLTYFVVKRLAERWVRQKNERQPSD
jgi:uncharacterized protein (DUF2062 family)